MLSSEEMDQFNAFINDISPQHPQLASSLNQSIKQSFSVSVFKKECPKVIQPKSTNFLDFDPIEIARQLTLIDQDLLLSICPTDLIPRNSSTIRSKPVMSYVTHFNKIASSIATLVLLLPTLSERVSYLKHIIRVLQECIEINNFGSSMALMAAISSAPIYRLKNTWTKFNSKHTKSQVLHQQQKDLLSPNSSYGKLREQASKDDTPQIPYLGMIMSDITIFTDLIPTFLSTGAWNFDKMEKVVSVIKDFMRVRKWRYNFSEVPIIKNFILGMTEMNTDQQYARSLVIEPRAS
uniref:Ras-GEF domain-containing protein n=1 Tax=Arcella intermedia TaxID=1963864 RepID=A0A6B2LBH8_9EUKA